MTPPTIAIIGAGFSGTLLALHLLRRCPPGVRIVLIERGRFGRGMAYSTGNASHLLNVPAGRMSAFHDEPGHFLAWLRTHPDAERAMPGAAASEAGTFVPRRLYGAYIRSLLKDELRRDPRRRLELVRGDVLGIDRTGSPLRLALDRDRTVVAHYAALAIGNFPPAPPRAEASWFYDSPLYRADPWAPDTLAGLAPEAPVLIVGTGLTTVDMVISLLDRGHRGPIHAVSRRGLLPRRHVTAPVPEQTGPAGVPTRVAALLRDVRRNAAGAVAAGGTWHSVIDGLRPFTQDIWHLLTPEDRARFLRHARPWWDVHRHRMAPLVADRIEAAREAGQLTVRAARIRDYRLQDGGVAVTLRPRGAESDETLQVARVLNCSGPGADYDRITDKLVRSLLANGTARPDALRLGLDVTVTGALLHREGTISRRIFALGPVTKGTFWEIVAVPDIRRQAELLAQHLALLVQVRPIPPAPEPPPLGYAI